MYIGVYSLAIGTYSLAQNLKMYKASKAFGTGER